MMSKVNKCKIINKRGQCRFVIHSLKGQRLNEREVFAINNKEVEGLLSIDVNKKGAAFKLYYDLAGLVKLEDFLINPLNRESFGKLLQDILDVFKGLQTVFFNQTNLILDFDKVMVNPATQKLNFIYVPIQSFNSGGTLRTFLLNIIQRSSFIAGEDSGYVKEYIKILNNGLNFSVFELEEYIKGLISEQGYQNPKTTICHKCGTNAPSGTNYCPVCGVKLSSISDDMGNRAIYDPLLSIPNEPGTSVLGIDSLEDEKVSYLKYKKTGEKIYISKDFFYIGRSAQNCDYVIGGNSAVSGRHAVIRRYGKRFFVKDLDSTNGTFVEDRQIRDETELHSAMKVKLANEEFEFYVD